MIRFFDEETFGVAGRFDWPDDGWAADVALVTGRLCDSDECDSRSSWPDKLLKKILAMIILEGKLQCDSYPNE